MNSQYYIRPDGSLGFVPLSILGTKVAASTVSTVASTLLPALFKDNYAEANAAIDQVNQISANNAQSIHNLQSVSNQVVNAYREAINATNAKVQELRNQPPEANNNTMKGLLIAMVVVTAAGIAINQFA